MKVGGLGILAGISVAVLSPKTAGGRIPSFFGSSVFFLLTPLADYILSPVMEGNMLFSKSNDLHDILKINSIFFVLYFFFESPSANVYQLLSIIR